MDSVFVVTTSTEGLKPLGTAPQRSFELLASSLSEDQAALFAEPVSSVYGDKVDWYTSRSGRVQPLSALDEDAQANVKARLQTLVNEIREIADAYLAEEDDPDRQRLGEALSNALEVPSEESIYAQVAQDGSFSPVLVNWAWVEDRRTSVRGVLSGADTRAPRMAEMAASTAQAGGTEARDTQPSSSASAPRAARASLPAAFFWWLYGLGWLFLAMIVAVIFVLLIAPCTLRIPGVANYCPGAEETASDQARTLMTLRDRVAILERQLEIADRACQPEPGIPDFLPPPTRPVNVPEPPLVSPEQSSDIGERLDRAGAQVGDLTFSLVWNSPDDLDLEVTCPLGDRLFWGTRQGCQGRVDTDSGTGGPALNPVENIFFLQPVTGEYAVRVTMPTSRNQGAPAQFKLLIRDGEQEQVLEGVVSGRERAWNHNYQFGGN
ncbi:MAG: hypothetical protein AAF922_13175 [Pseudomonadota bacterium]